MPPSQQSPAEVSLARVINAFASAWDNVATAVGVAEARPTASSDQRLHFKHDQSLKALEIATLHSIAQQLAATRHGIIPTTHPAAVVAPSEPASRVGSRP